MPVTLEQRQLGATTVRQLVEQAARSKDWTTAARWLGEAAAVAQALAERGAEDVDAE